MAQLSGSGMNFGTSVNGTSAWLFIGTNSTYPGDPGIGIDLGNTPATYNPTLWQTDFSTTSGAPLASVLLCDPRIDLLSAMVTYSPANNTLSISCSDTVFPSVGNIDLMTARIVLSQALLDATTPGQSDSFDWFLMSTISSQLFLDITNGSELWHPVHSASNISSSIGAYFSSATKAWSDGYQKTDLFSTVILDAVKQEERMVLVASMLFTISAGVLAIFVLGLGTAQLRMQQGTPLGIRSLEEALGGIQMGDMSLVTLPLQVLNRRRQVLGHNTELN